ncbi:MAG: hypothetical protein ABIO70_10900 [Pseudomonadota bacterium]
MTTPRAILLLVALLLPACQEQKLSVGGDTANEQAPDEGVTDYLRVDVYPSDANPTLQPETHLLDETWEGLSIDMAGPATLSGEVFGYDASPWFAIEVPGTSMPVKARVSLSRPGTIMAASVTSDASDDGAFSLSLPSSGGYVFSVVPLEPALLPMWVEQDYLLAADHIGEEVDLGYGAPVYGQVLGADGEDLSRLHTSVHVRDPETGVESSPIAVDETGAYQLRVEPGASYEVVLSGSIGDLVPTVAVPVAVEDEDGAELDFQVGSLAPIEVSGRLLAAESSVAVSGATVRFTAVELKDHPGAELVVDDITSSRGEYRVNLLAGRYKAEYIAPASWELSPALEAIDVEAGTPIQDLDQRLDALAPVTCQILGPGGRGLSGVSVVATEEGFDGYTYATTTDGDGRFTLDVPATKLRFAFTPPEGEAAVTYLEVPIDDFPAVLMLDMGDVISGTVKHDDEPVSYAVIEVRDSLDRLYATTLTGEDGGFTVRVHWEGAE